MKYLSIAIFAVLVLAFSPKAFAIQDPFINDVPTDPCGEIDPTKPCYAAGADKKCQKGNSYDSCKNYCVCIYNQNVKKCDRNITCLDLATSEKNACLGNCITDWN